MQVADQLRVGLGELPERAVQEFDAGRRRCAPELRLEGGLEAELAQLRFQRPHAAPAPGAPTGVAAPVAADLGGVDGVGTDVLGQRREQPGEQRVRGGVEAEPGSAGGKEVEVLGPTDSAPVDRLDVDETSLAEPLEVEPHGVRVQIRGASARSCADRRRVDRASSSYMA